MSALLGFAPAAGSPVSIRVRGAAAALAATKKPLMQAAPLTVDMIRALERIVVKFPYPHWCVIAGQILFCVGSCARFSNTMYLDSLRMQQCRRCVSPGCRFCVLQDCPRRPKEPSAAAPQFGVFLVHQRLGAGLDASSAGCRSLAEAIPARLQRGGPMLAHTSHVDW